MNVDSGSISYGIECFDDGTVRDMTRFASDPSRIVIATTVPETIEAFVVPQLESLTNLGWKVDLVSSPAFEGRQSGVTTHGLAMRREISARQDLQSLRQWVSLLKDLRPQVVVSSTPKAAMLANLAGKQVGVPRRIYLHRGAKWETEVGVRRAIVKAGDWAAVRSSTEVLAVSNSLADVLIGNRIASRRPTVLGSGGARGVDLERFVPGADETRARREFTLGYVGRLNRDKGISELLQVFDQVKAEIPQTRLLIAGGLDTSAPIPESEMRRIESDDSIDWAGYVSEVERVFQAMDVLVFPSRREGLAEVIIEAAASGVPTVAWTVTGVRDAVSHGVSGFLVATGDVVGMTSRILEIHDAGGVAFTSGCRAWSMNFEAAKLTELFIDYIGAPGSKGNVAR